MHLFLQTLMKSSSCTGLAKAPATVHIPPARLLRAGLETTSRRNSQGK